MSSVHLGRALFAARLIAMVTASLAGRSLEPELTALGLERYRAAHLGLEGSAFLLFVFGFPVGLCACLLGVALAGGEPWRQAWWFGALALPGVGIVTAFPDLVGKEPSSSYFGVGGICILALASVVVWWWGVRRARRTPRHRAALDLQIIGYLCFALAAWNLCGFASVPALALFPERMSALRTETFAVGQLKAVMALLVLGWLFTALGFRRALKDEEDREPRDQAR